MRGGKDDRRNLMMRRVLEKRRSETDKRRRGKSGGRGRTEKENEIITSGTSYGLDVDLEETES